MRTHFFLLLVVVTLAAWGNAFVDAKESTQSSIQNSNTRPSTIARTRRYLKGSITEAANEHATTTTDEERISFPGGDKLKSLLQKVPKLNKVKSLFQKNPALVKGLEKPELKEKLSAFFKENPAIKKELIIAAVILTVLFGTPVVVNSFY